MIKLEKLVPELRFKGFDEGWNLHKLGELGTFKNGLNKDSSEFGHGSPFVNLMDVFGKSILTESNFGLVNSNEKDKENYNLVKGDVLFIRSSVKRTGVGETILVAHDIPNTVYSGFLIRFRDRNKELGLNFKSYCFSNAPFRKELLSYATSSANTNINQESLAQIKLFFPSLPEQQKIASFLSAVDEKIQQLTRKKELLVQYKKGVMQQLFSGKLRFKDENGDEYPDWEEKRLMEVSVFLDGKRKPIKGEDRSKMKGIYPYYGASGIIDYVNDYIFDEELILLGEDGENIVSRNLPLAFRVSGKCWVNNHAHVIKPINNNNIDFLTYSLERINYVIYNTGTAQPKLNQEVCRNIPLLIPSIFEQAKIANFLSNIDTKIESTTQQINQTQTFKKGLLQKMFV
jgi:type I restriction enzyme, S subunit